MTEPDGGTDGSPEGQERTADGSPEKQEGGADGSIAKCLSALAPPGGTVSALAVGADGTILAERAPDRALAPASNTKLVTAALALDELGPEFRFETSIRARGVVAGPDERDGTLDGDLLVVGSGSPALELDDLRALGQAVAADVSRVTGDLVVDTSLFEGPQHGPGRTWGDLRHAYGAPTAAFSVAGNTVTVTVEGDGHDGFDVTVSPDTSAVEAAVDLTASDGEGSDRDGDRASDDATVTVRTDADGTTRIAGQLPPDGEFETEAPVRRPVVHAGEILHGALVDAGVTIEGGIEGGLVIADGPPAAPADRVLATVESAPLGDLVRETNVHSDNVSADSLARVVAAHATGTGSWAAWADLAADRFADLGVETVRIRDGSGLSRYNRVPARGIVALLRWAAEADWGPAFFDSLPGPGEGTLADRLDGVPVVAKTGTLTGTRALSGRLALPEGAVYFSLLVDDLTVATEHVRDRQDDLVRSLAGA